MFRGVLYNESFEEGHRRLGGAEGVRYHSTANEWKMLNHSRFVPIMGDDTFRFGKWDFKVDGTHGLIPSSKVGQRRQLWRSVR